MQWKLSGVILVLHRVLRSKGRRCSQDMKMVSEHFLPIILVGQNQNLARLIALPLEALVIGVVVLQLAEIQDWRIMVKILQVVLHLVMIYLQ